MYTVRNFRFTEAQGWVADVLTDGATLPHSLTLDTINAADCHNFEQAYITAACLPCEPMFGLWVDVVQPEPLNLGPQEPPDDYRIYNRRQADGTYPPLSGFFDEAVRRADAGQSEPATAGEQADAAYMQADLGTRFIVSGGDVLELDSQPNGGDADIPF